MVWLKPQNQSFFKLWHLCCVLCWWTQLVLTKLLGWEPDISVVYSLLEAILIAWSSCWAGPQQPQSSPLISQAVANKRVGQLYFCPFAYKEVNWGHRGRIIWDMHCFRSWIMTIELLNRVPAQRQWGGCSGRHSSPAPAGYAGTRGSMEQSWGRPMMRPVGAVPQWGKSNFCKKCFP